jgi:hypothetical protein
MTNSYPAPHFILNGVSVFMAEAMKTKIHFVKFKERIFPQCPAGGAVVCKQK